MSEIPRIEFQIISDLHLETPKTRPSYGEVTIEPRAAHLALLGDIGNVCDDRLFVFLETQLSQFYVVFFLLGNHEPYGASFPAARAIMRSFQDKVNSAQNKADGILGTFVFLDQTRFDLTSWCTILGCTLFSRILPEQVIPVQMFLSDFSNIEHWAVEDHNEAHNSDLAWLNREISSISQQDASHTIIIFTHHSPTINAAAFDPKHASDAAQVRSGFATDLSKELCWTSPQVKLWAFGHTHFNCDFEDPLTGKRVCANQKGYRRAEAVNFDPVKVVECEKPQISRDTVSGQDQIHRVVLERKHPVLGTARAIKCNIL